MPTTGDLAYLAGVYRAAVAMSKGGEDDAIQTYRDTAAALDWAVREIAVRDRALESMALALAHEYGVREGDSEDTQRAVVADYVRIHTAVAREALAREQEAPSDRSH